MNGLSVNRLVDEKELASIAASLAKELRPGDRVLLEGEMGAGKSTFARFLIAALGAERPAEGSPTFALAHEYAATSGAVIHIDFYRLKHEDELAEAGLESALWDRPDAIVITEWLSNFPELERAVLERGGGEKGRRNWRVVLEIVPEDSNRRRIQLT